MPRAGAEFSLEQDALTAINEELARKLKSSDASNQDLLRRLEDSIAGKVELTSKVDTLLARIKQLERASNSSESSKVNVLPMVLRVPEEQRTPLVTRLLETFVELPRFSGTCYKAANWIHVGQTQGRGKRDTCHEASLPKKRSGSIP